MKMFADRSHPFDVEIYFCKHLNPGFTYWKDDDLSIPSLTQFIR
jgi:hypothetical protein